MSARLDSINDQKRIEVMSTMKHIQVRQNRYYYYFIVERGLTVIVNPALEGSCTLISR